MTDGINLDGFTANRKPAGKHNIGEQYAAAPRAAFPAKDVSTQGNAGFNAEGSYDMGNRKETNAYPESENM
jgi:hypothetical protein